MRLVESTEYLYTRKKQASHADEAPREQALRGKRLERRLACQKCDSWALQRRVRPYGNADCMLRPLKVRVALAKRTVIKNKI